MNGLKTGTPAMDAYLTIKNAISTQKLKPGDVLTENYLCGALGLGRSPVRAALQQLSQDGFVELPPNRSARVAQFSHNQVLYGFFQSAARQLRGLRVLDSLTLEIFLDGIQEHHAIAEAIAARNPALAKELMQLHLKKDYAQYLLGIDLLDSIK